MEHNVVVRMAKVLYGMVLAVFVFNLLVLPLVPGYTMMAYEGMGMGHPSISSLMGTMRSLLGAGVPAWEILVVRPLAMLGGDWSGYGPEVWWSAAFFLGCGICTAVLLWQARCILSTIIAQTPFQRSNARSMKRAAASCWGIALLAAVRMAVWFLRLRSAAPLFTFTALFIPVSLMAGLLFLVMSALFRQAAALLGAAACTGAGLVGSGGREQVVRLAGETLVVRDADLLHQVGWRYVNLFVHGEPLACWRVS